MTLTQFHQGIHKHLRFYGHAGSFLDTLFLQLGQVKIDIYALDDLLHSRHGDFEDAGMSTADVLIKEYGQAAHDFIKSLL